MSRNDEIVEFIEQLFDEAEKEISRDFLKAGSELDDLMALKEEHLALQRVRKALRRNIEEAKR